jgi:hypothetical protein
LSRKAYLAQFGANKFGTGKFFLFVFGEKTKSQLELRYDPVLPGYHGMGYALRAAARIHDPAAATADRLAQVERTDPLGGGKRSLGGATGTAPGRQTWPGTLCTLSATGCIDHVAMQAALHRMTVFLKVSACKDQITCISNVSLQLCLSPSVTMPGI